MLEFIGMILAGLFLVGVIFFGMAEVFMLCVRMFFALEGFCRRRYFDEYIINIWTYADYRTKQFKEKLRRRL